MTVKAIYNKSDNPPTLFFSVENASKPVEIFGDHIPTTKPDPELHGFGLPNVMDILHKYDVFYLMDYRTALSYSALNGRMPPTKKPLLLHKNSKTCSCARNFAVLPFFWTL